MAPFESTLTLADLDSWNHQGTALAVLGYPVKHSVSPAMHNAALADMSRRDARFADWRYFKFEVPPDHLPSALEQFYRRDFLGLNLTVPHKVIALDCVRNIDPEARPLGAVNTLRWTPDGYEGFNTDGYGLRAGLLQDLQADPADSPVILLGAGGAARAAAVECARLGCPALFLGNRTPSKLEPIIEAVRSVRAKAEIHTFDPARPGTIRFPEHALFVNATSAGLDPSAPAPFDLRALPASAKVYDMIYNPPQTALLRQAAALGLPCANGLSMLVHQGVRALEIWTGTEVPAAAMQKAAEAALSR